MKVIPKQAIVNECFIVITRVNINGVMIITIVLKVANINCKNEKKKWNLQIHKSIIFVRILSLASEKY